jgi:hypothetical protein
MIMFWKIIISLIVYCAWIYLVIWGASTIFVLIGGFFGAMVAIGYTIILYVVIKIFELCFWEEE